MSGTGFSLERGRYRARLAEGVSDREALARLRHQAFFGGPGRDRDSFDDICRHLLVEPREGGAPLACFRLLQLSGGAEVSRSYAAQFYDLSGLSGFAGPLIEIGRFCLAPGLRDPDVARLAWGALTALVDAAGVEMLFGCASFPGTDPEAHRAAFARLGAHHLGPEVWRPRVKAARVVSLGGFSGEEGAAPDPRAALKGMPPLLKSYLAMGGWVSDHAVVDVEMNTLHVFTGVEIGRIPAARKRALRAVAG
ncbi:GNAT family N-acetyltransferase [Roseivivax sp. GX 12232]|uniref:GNAT family N-acetyltransferase n=1 Tax=Roseivivax sp. GX 12232 TaxID=2900547 RepID=UPI001E40EE27|nr:GNAT family N-acyltransferase [Roseivivax sp. GX 12232]MCE0504649.1 GNAT family N-acetyltransferase [Roseivivax sp. GX 12232]